MSELSCIPAVKKFILDRFLAGEDPENLTPTTPLVTGGILDSLGLLEVVSHLETTYGVEFEAHEVDAAAFDTLASIDDLLQRKLRA
jgi:acyl carrier protein